MLKRCLVQPHLLEDSVHVEGVGPHQQEDGQREGYDNPQHDVLGPRMSWQLSVANFARHKSFKPKTSTLYG